MHIMNEIEVELQTPKGKMRVFFARPDTGGPYPLALISPDGLGYRDSLKEIARRYAQAGFCCALADWMYRCGEPLDVMKDPGAVLKLRQRIVDLLTDPKGTFVSDAQVVIDHAKASGWASVDRVVTVGYCWGASVSVHLLAEYPGQVVAGAGFHPFWLTADGQTMTMHEGGAPEPPVGVAEVPKSLLDELGRVRGEVYFGVPESDRWINQASFRLLAQEMTQRGVRGEVEVYPGTLHGFAVPGGMGTHAEASERHYTQTVQLWRRNLA
jgi:carboxymethylenebutenolidase